MYEMLAIRRLFHRESDFLTFKAITEEPIPDIRERRPDLPPGMRAALLQAMARDVNGRFDTAQAFGNALRNAVATLGGPATPADLARLLLADFGDEMIARDEILAGRRAAPPRPAARDPAAAAAGLGAPDRRGRRDRRARQRPNRARRRRRDPVDDRAAGSARPPRSRPAGQRSICRAT